MEATTALPICAGSAAFECGVDVFKVGRACGARCCWSLEHIYTCLGLTCFGHSARRWVPRGLSACEKSWENAFGWKYGMFVLSMDPAFDDNARHKCDLPIHQRCLEVNALSTPAFLLTLARWSHCPVGKQGGLTSISATASARLLFGSLTSLLQDMEFKIPMALIQTYTSPWPRPLSSWQTRVVHIQLTNLILDVSPLAAGAWLAGPVQDQWSRSLRTSSDSGVNSAVPVSAFLQTIMGELGSNQ